MASHNCGTCFFFQEANFAGNGWCLHAERAKTADGRTLVRRNELACRNDWGRSLWTDPKAAIEAGVTRNQISVQAERPATQGEIGFMVKSREAHVPASGRSERIVRPEPNSAEVQRDVPAGEDVVVSQISFMAPGPNGHRRLVDQVPADVMPRTRPGSDERLPLASTETRAPHEDGGSSEDRPPGRTYATEPVENVRIGRDRLSRRSIRPEPTGPSSFGSPTMSTGNDAAVSEDAARQVDWRGRDDRPERVPREETYRPEPVMAGTPPADPESMWRPPAGDETPGNPTSVVPRGLRRAPIPGPVPARELRRDATRDEERPAALPRMAEATRTRAEPAASPVQATPRPPLPRLAPSGHDIEQPANRSSSGQRPVLPDLLPDEAFPRVHREALPVSQPVNKSTGSPDGREWPAVGERRGPGERQVPVRRTDHEPTPRPSMAGSMEEPVEGISRADDGGSHPGRPRPAVPRMTPARPRPAPPPVRSIPTVAEANRAIGDRPDGQPAGQDRSSALARSDSPTTHDDRLPGDRTDASLVTDEPQAPAQLQPPTPLRPAREDFGVYSSWLDLQSVEPRLSPHLQRACETCRDFRPSENPERGWCANRDSFTLRTVVNAGDLPCISSFGCWWVPYDDVWLSEAAVRDHRNPTPLLDQLFSAEEQGVGARRRRRS